MTNKEIYEEYSSDPIKWMKENKCKTTKEITLMLMEMAREKNISPNHSVVFCEKCEENRGHESLSRTTIRCSECGNIISDLVYRDLKNGDVIEKNDEYLTLSGNWVKTQSVGEYYNVFYFKRYRRIDDTIYKPSKYSGQDDRYDNELEEARCNQRLISKAPELLDALQDLVKYCEDNEVYAELEYAKDVINNAIG